MFRNSPTMAAPIHVMYIFYDTSAVCHYSLFGTQCANFGKVAHLHLQFYAILFYLVKVLLEKLTGDMKMTRL